MTLEETLNDIIAYIRDKEHKTEEEVAKVIDEIIKLAEEGVEE